MGYTSVSEALETVLEEVPGVRSVTSGLEFRPTRRGGVVPKTDQAPAIRITQDAVRYRGETLDGTRIRTSRYICALWAYEDDATLATTSWNDLRDSVNDTVKVNRLGFASLPGVRDVRLFAEQPASRPIPVAGSNRALLTTQIILEVVEEV